MPKLGVHKTNTHMYVHIVAHTDQTFSYDQGRGVIGELIARKLGKEVNQSDVTEPFPKDFLPFRVTMSTTGITKCHTVLVKKENIFYILHVSPDSLYKQKQDMTMFSFSKSSKPKPYADLSLKYDNPGFTVGNKDEVDIVVIDSKDGYFDEYAKLQLQEQIGCEIKNLKIIKLNDEITVIDQGRTETELRFGKNNNIVSEKTISSNTDYSVTFIPDLDCLMIQGAKINSKHEKTNVQFIVRDVFSKTEYEFEKYPDFEPNFNKCVENLFSEVNTTKTQISESDLKFK